MGQRAPVLRSGSVALGRIRLPAGAALLLWDFRLTQRGLSGQESPYGTWKESLPMQQIPLYWCWTADRKTGFHHPWKRDRSH